MTQASKVAEIFSTAGDAFTKLGNLAMTLQSGAEKGSIDGRWGDEEIDMLQNAVKQFGSNVEKISTKVKNKAATQAKSALKQKGTIHSIGTSLPVGLSLGTTFPLPSSTSTIVGLRPQIKMQSTSRQIGQKSAFQMTIRGATPMNTTQLGNKKIRLDTSAVNVLTSISQAPIGTLIRQNTPVAIAPVGVTGVNTIGVPIMASGQGFQVIVPPQKTVTSGGATVLPVSLLPSGVVQKVCNVSTNGNVDVES